jgi:pyruvate,water dikinase
VLVDIEAAHGTDEVGGKGAGLARLARAGLPVPATWVLPASVLGEWLWAGGRMPYAPTKGTEGPGLGALAEQVEEALGHGDWQASARRLRAAVLNGALPGGVTEPIDEMFRGLGIEALAVRSSATCEGLPGASFAGQFQTFLDIRDTEQACAAIRSCWASSWSPAALAYRRTKDPSAGSPNAPLPRGSESARRTGQAGRPMKESVVQRPGMAVLLQAFVDATAAGSARVDDGGVHVESAWGLGASVMSGLVVPDRYEFGHDGRPIETRLGWKPTKATASGGNLVWQKVPTELRGASSLDAASAREVAGLASRAAEVLGSPLEVEWALCEGRLWLLQGRRVGAPCPAAAPQLGALSPAAAPSLGAPTPTPPPNLGKGIVSRQLQGIPAAPGEVAGRVRLVRRTEDAVEVQGDEIVVTRYASAALAARLRASGLITEMGGSSGHAASIARERRMPMITGVLGAMRRLRDGELISMDGASGLILCDSPKMRPKPAVIRVPGRLGNG